MRILVIRGGAIGDFLVTLPALQALRRFRPDAEIHLLGRPAIRSLAILPGVCDGFTSLEEARFASLYSPDPRLPESPAGFFAPFDWIISYLHDPDGLLGSKFDGLGFHQVSAFAARPGRRLWIHGDPLIRTGPAARQLAEPVQILGAILTDPIGTLTLSDQAIEAAEQFWGREEDRFRIVLHPGSGSPSKNWPADRWRSVLERIASEIPRARLIVTGGEADGAALAAFDRRGPWRCHRSADLLETAALLAQADRFLGHDSGISHLAAALGTPGLLLFGPTDPAVWAPPVKRIRVIRAGTGLMEDISTDEVWQEARRFLAS
jgi:heptosyltransferase-3